jgi:uncharacterized protein YbaR (Trm112 family)
MSDQQAPASRDRGIKVLSCPVCRNELIYERGETDEQAIRRHAQFMYAVRGSMSHAALAHADSVRAQG